MRVIAAIQVTRSLTPFIRPLLSGALSDLAYFRKQNPSARLLASLGGEAVGPAVFGGLLQPEGSLANLTSSVNALFREGVIDGVEIDWEWPAGSGDKEDREKLVKYARVRDIGRRQLCVNGMKLITGQKHCQPAKLRVNALALACVGVQQFMCPHSSSSPQHCAMQI